MSDLFSLLTLLALTAMTGLWLKLSAAREAAIREARRQCEQHGLQLLDETVGLRALRLCRVNGLRHIERCYGFEVSIDGRDRQSCRMWMLGNVLRSLSLPTIDSLPHEEARQRPALASPSGNVLPFRPRETDRPN